MRPRDNTEGIQGQFGRKSPQMKMDPKRLEKLSAKLTEEERCFESAAANVPASLPSPDRDAQIKQLRLEITSRKSVIRRSYGVQSRSSDLFTQNSTVNNSRGVQTLNTSPITNNFEATTPLYYDSERNRSVGQHSHSGFNMTQQLPQLYVSKSDDRPTTAQRQDGIIPRSRYTNFTVSTRDHGPVGKESSVVGDATITEDDQILFPTRQSTLEASTPKRLHAKDFHGDRMEIEALRDSNIHNDLEDNMLTEVRSKIACVRCRRRKTKCHISSTNGVCRACAAKSLACVYSASQQVNIARPSRTKGGESKRMRKLDATKQSLRHTDDPFQSPPILPKLWKEVYNTFLVHCSTELPFLHEEVFHARVQPTAKKSTDIELYLLGMLALTARFIPDLIEFHDPFDPLAASEFYAKESAARIDALALTEQPTLERVQGLLMISLYHWGMCRGHCAWMYVTIATRMAQTLGLMFEEQEPAPPTPTSPAGFLQSTVTEARNDEQTLIQREIKRRTAYSCFILDRYQATERYHPQLININDLHVQLPCSEEDFQFGANVKTGSLLQPFNSKESSRTISSTQVLSIYIQLVEIWGRLSQWSNRGGRREEKHPPWDYRSDFYRLQQQLVSFFDSLPQKLTFSPTKIAPHIANGSITLYIAIHTLYSLCNIVLHYEYIPLLPLRSDSSSRPLDDRILLLDKWDKCDAPKEFWDEAAKLVFNSARNITDIVQATSDRHIKVESIQVGFAVRAAALVGIYSINFPYMDKNSYMCDLSSTHQSASLNSEKGATGLAIKTLDLMKPKSKMATDWSDWIKCTHNYFENIKTDHIRSIEAPDPPNFTHQHHLAQVKKLSLREIGLGMDCYNSAREISHKKAVDSISGNLLSHN